MEIHLELINKQLILLQYNHNYCTIWRKQRTVQCQIRSSEPIVHHMKTLLINVVIINDHVRILASKM